MCFLGTVGVTYVEWKSLARLHRLHVSLAIIVCCSAKTTGSEPEFLDLIFYFIFGNYYWLFFIGNVWDWFKIGIIDSVEKR